ncbi:hypothetical protein [Absiella sp. AM29-15]|uniref:hypothetical protein n=1 Tax=Absiella sp. AM29-15 TaxID=2292278 RepID=UPI000E400ACF|nr:hypothetical protein [Absiella sp. AM29-15]RGC50847.1 hypothetical protein DW761_11280 [Absiella sp. AM29-15]
MNVRIKTSDKILLFLATMLMLLNTLGFVFQVFGTKIGHVLSLFNCISITAIYFLDKKPFDRKPTKLS